ncbi:zf-TFIIB domain-containing protein [Candidatus Gottesmanbacteria bacterium]|nr:zf-TFIIB domain-containing protein [Candidatus Gottesmanbacteria bacterium]
MSCPSCGYLLQKLEVHTNTGGKFAVDHCGRCGGTWFDPYEINRIPYHEVMRIAHLTVLPKAPPTQQSSHKCPRCHKELVPSHYESVPKGVHMLRCSRCGGIWATQKALTEFKKHQQDSIEEYKQSGVAFPSLSVVFVPALFLLLLIVSTFITVSRLQEAKEGRIKAAELITNLQVVPIPPTSTSITFTTKVELKSRIYYGTSSLELTPKTVSLTPSATHGILLTGLRQNTTYLFRLELEDETGRKVRTEMQSFKIGNK